ncbi:MAG TPA: hypothetical protein VMT79_20430, partial [Candidatus Binatia bacterium]|nr:hypothetical protein [Candidatus Binatia bacterium]
MSSLSSTATSRAGAWAVAWGSAAIILCGFGLLGWTTPWRALASIYPGSIPMAPSTALALSALGAVVILGARRPSPRLTTVVSLLVASLAGVQLATL